MFSVSSTVNLDFGTLNMLEENAAEALAQTADALLTEVKNAQVMPKDTGNLQIESTFVDDRNARKGTVVLSSSTPYARRLYFHPEYHFNRADNAMAQGEWLKFWLPGGTRQNFCVKKFMEIYRGLCGL